MLSIYFVYIRVAVRVTEYRQDLFMLPPRGNRLFCLVPLERKGSICETLFYGDEL